MASFPWQPQRCLVSGIGHRARYSEKFIWIFVSSVRYFCPVLIENEICRQILANRQEYQFSGNRVVLSGQTDGHRDRHDEANRPTAEQ
jgi:hypothetical protein